jgi:hypothetical protein
MILKWILREAREDVGWIRLGPSSGLLLTRKLILVSIKDTEFLDQLRDY